MKKLFFIILIFFSKIIADSKDDVLVYNLINSLDKLKNHSSGLIKKDSNNVVFLEITKALSCLDLLRNSMKKREKDLYLISNIFDGLNKVLENTLVTYNNDGNIDFGIISFRANELFNHLKHIYNSELNSYKKVQTLIPKLIPKNMANTIYRKFDCTADALYNIDHDLSDIINLNMSGIKLKSFGIIAKFLNSRIGRSYIVRKPIKLLGYESLTNDYSKLTKIQRFFKENNIEEPCKDVINFLDKNKGIISRTMKLFGFGLKMIGLLFKNSDNDRKVKSKLFNYIGFINNSYNKAKMKIFKKKMEKVNKKLFGGKKGLSVINNNIKENFPGIVCRADMLKKSRLSNHLPA